MKNAVFIDTGAFIALAVKSDQHHQQALKAVKEVESLGPRVTTQMVLIEAATYLQRRVSFDTSSRFWASILSEESEIHLFPMEKSDLERAHEIAKLYADRPFSWVDCTSFAFIERQKIPHVFSFDQDFLIFQPSHGSLHRIPF